MNAKKKSPALTEETNLNSPLIISGKTYTVKELCSIFNYKSLLLVESKEELIKYWQMAVETGIRQFINAVDSVYEKRFPQYE